MRNREPGRQVLPATLTARKLGNGWTAAEPQLLQTQTVVAQLRDDLHYPLGEQPTSHASVHHDKA